ncbi:MAG: four helix bundle protein [bacterium]
MKNNRELRKRLYDFALRIVKFVQLLPKNWVALEIGRQVLRSGTSVDANYEEACGAFSRSDFVYKLNTSFKEAKESNYWLRLLYDSKIVTNGEIRYLLRESEEIRNILGKGVKTARTDKK